MMKVAHQNQGLALPTPPALHLARGHYSAVHITMYALHLVYIGNTPVSHSGADTLM